MLARRSLFTWGTTTDICNDCRLAEVARPTELRAAVQIQAAARGFLQRKYLKQFM